MTHRLHSTFCQVLLATSLGLSSAPALAQSEQASPQGPPSAAESPSPPEKLVIPKMVAAVAKSVTGLGKTLSSGCYIEDTKFLTGPVLLLVAGQEICKRAYSENKHFYVVYRGSEKYYVAKGDVELSDEEAATVEQLSDEQREPFARQAEQGSLLLRKKQLEEAMTELDRHKKTGLTVVRASINDVSEYTQGTSFSVEVMNRAAKPIKYVWFTVVGYNAVGDPVGRGAGASKTVKGIGPIGPDDSGSYEWKYFWHTDIVQSYKISTIKWQYMDGSTRETSNVKAISVSKSTRAIMDEVSDR